MIDSVNFLVEPFKCSVNRTAEKLNIQNKTRPKITRIKLPLACGLIEGIDVGIDVG